MSVSGVHGGRRRVRGSGNLSVNSRGTLSFVVNTWLVGVTVSCLGYDCYSIRSDGLGWI